MPLVGLFILGLVQLLPLGSAASADGNSAQLKTISFDPYSTRLALVQIAALAIYFAATLAFTDSPHRLRILVRTITIFGFVLAIFGLTQSFTSPTKVFWIRELMQSTAFGPFINRHHFAGYMELAMAVPLGLLFSESIEKEKRPLYAFAIFMMGVALIMTASRGGIISLVAEVGFLVIIAGVKRRKRRHRSEEKERKGGKSTRVRSAMVRAGLAFAFVLLIFTGVVMLGGESALTRFLGSVSSSDPTTGRAHFWSVTLDIIRHHPMTGVGLGAYSLVYTSYDTRNVGTSKTVNISGIGAGAGNYHLVNTTANASADITQRDLHVAYTADDKVYDGTNTAVINNRVLSGVIGSNVVTLIGGTATFDNRNVGTNKTVTATGLAL